jgi:prepilin-type processing-associated H-X9-DG protein
LADIEVIPALALLLHHPAQGDILKNDNCQRPTANHRTALAEVPAMPKLRMTIRRWMIAIALIAIVMPVVLSVASARESVQRAKCAFNLKQIRLALSNYHSAYGGIPPATVGNTALPPDRRLSWTVTLFPYITQGLGVIVDLKEAWDSPANLRPLFRHTSIEGPPPSTTPAMDCPYFLECPSHHVPASSTAPAPAGYVGISGLGTDAVTLGPPHPRAGVFGYDRVTQMKDITDGASTTMMLAETATARGPWNAGGPATVRSLDPSLQPYIGPARQFGGTHRGGANVLFVDGSVRFLSVTIDPKVFEALSTIAGGEQLPRGWDQ